MIKRPMLWIFMAYAAGSFSVWIRKAKDPAVWAAGILALFLVIILFILYYCILKSVSHPIQSILSLDKTDRFLLTLPFWFLLGIILTDGQLAMPKMDGIFRREIEVRAEGFVSKVDKREKGVSINLIKTKIWDNETGSLYEPGRILVYGESGIDILPGNRIQIEGTLHKFQKPGNPGQFDEKLYYQSKKIIYKMYADSIIITDEKYSFFHKLLRNIRDKLGTVYQTVFHKKDAGVIKAMVLGEKRELDTEIKGLYQKNGIAHILAISGLHISFIGLFFFHILQRIGVPEFVGAPLTILLIFSYGIMTGFSVSTNRAVVMLILTLMARIISRTYDMISAACLGALLILIQEPLQLYQSGFLLSFGAIAAIAIVFPILEEEFLGERKNSFLQSFLLSLSIQLVTMPVILFFYYEIPVYAVILNLFILPLMSLLLVLALGTGIIGCVSLPGAVFLGGGVHGVLWLYEGLCHIFARLPGSCVIAGKPTLIKILIYYFILSVFLLMIGKYRKNRENKDSIKRGIVCAGLIVSFIMVLFLRPGNGKLNITFLDVGQGDGIVIKTAEGKIVMVDGGSSDVKELGKYRMEPYLKSKGIGKIHFAFITHADRDHINGIMEMMGAGEIEVENLVLPFASPQDQAYKNLEQTAFDNGVKVLYISKGQQIKLGELVLRCLHPTADFIAADRNAYSTVLEVRYKAFGMLLTGDLEAEGESVVTKLLEKERKKYSVLKAAHHGSEFSTKMEFLAATEPEITVISCGEGNSYGHPHKETLKRLIQSGSRIYTTPDCGAVTVSTDGKKLGIKFFKK